MTVIPFLQLEQAHAHSTNCGTDPATFSGIVAYDSNVNNTYCELCGTGQIRLVVTNTSHRDMADFVVTHDFQSSDLEYVPGSTVGGGDPVISGTTLTWSAAQIPALAQIDRPPGGTHNYNSVDIIFSVRSIAGTEEDLVTANRNVSASADYVYCPTSTNVAATAASGQFLLDLREPNPVVTKLGRNYDANQDAGSYSATVYGNEDDDVIWRINITNTGDAGLQDLKFDDLMQNGNFDINYACPSEADAAAIAANNGTGPPGNCTSAGISNSIADFLVDNPYGNMAVSADGHEVDVTAGGSASIFLVGKITNSCIPNRSNTVSNVEWGCEVIAPDGGITQTSTGNSPGTSVGVISSLVSNNGLQIQRQLTGLNTAQPVGSRGLMTVTINNQTGGSVKNIHLRDVLPTQYVMDSTFTPTIAVTPAYNNYDGMIDTIVWTNPAANTAPLVNPPAGDPADPLSNTAPEFDLLSTTVNADNADQQHMMRHGDVAVITFRVVMIEQTYFDNNANIDVRIEDIGDGTDPNSSVNLNNQLYVTFNDFCTPAATQQPSSYPYNDSFPSDPEDLDIDISGTELIFILTNDPTQPLPLQVTLTNNGGHYADDYTAYVTFGTTMEISSAPAGCSPTTNPPTLEVWDDPADLPATATVYECNSANLGTIGPGGSINLDFEVIKTSDAVKLAEDDLSFRADVVGEIALSDGTLLWFPDPQIAPIVNRANNYSLDAIRARVIGFNLAKNVNGTCSENNPPSALPDSLVQIGEECTVRIDTGGWFGFQTPGFTYIAVQNIQVVDQLPDGQAYISSTNPALTSSGTITGISLNPGGLSALTEGWFNWTFNTVVPAERITVRDQWFRVDATTRLLNKPIDVSNAPNTHAALSRNVLNSTFEAVFNNALTMSEEVFALGPGTIGYPNEVVRRVDLRVTEPSINVTKEVCNETLNGAGTTCSNFVAIADDGDTQDSYIYRVTLSNQAAASGYTRAPAYDITATDVMDASDLVYVVPFNADGLDNDGDGLIDGADVNGEGTITDNTISNGTPATVDFSYTHSDALLRLDPNSSVTFYYRVDPDDAVAPLQQLSNSITVSYDSLEGASGNQTVVLSANSELGGARVYTGGPDTATIQILPLQSQPKEIINTSITPITGTPPQPVVVGEEVEYRLRALIPVANLRQFTVRDELPTGIRCTEAPVIDLDAPPYDAAGFSPGGQFTPTCNDNLVEWQFGDQELTTASSNNLFDFAVSFIARVENSAAVNDTSLISNGDPATNAFISYVNEAATTITQDFAQFDLQVTEPLIALTKTFESEFNDATDIITVTVTATNNGTATAYNLRVLDDLNAVANLTFLNNVGGTDPPDNVDTTTFGPNQPVFSWNPANPDFAIAPTETKSFTFDIQVQTGVQPDEILDNTIQADWTSLPNQNTALNATNSIGANGAIDGMRNGNLPNAGDAVNDYETNATDFSTVPPLTISKTDLNPALDPEIGAHKNFSLVINFPEGVTNDVIVTDQLDSADESYVLSNNAGFDISYTFNNITTINGMAPAEAVFNSFPGDATSGNAIWDIGTVVTPSEDDTTGTPSIDPSITINYYARINNDVNTDSGDNLQNGVIVNYSNGEDASTETLADNTPVVTAIEALLTVSKTATPVSALPVTGGDVIEYSITIDNTGNATAYDINVVDTLPADLELITVPTAPTAQIDGVDVAGFNASPANAPAGPLNWGRANSDLTLDVPAGSTLVITYQAQILEGVEANQSLNNSVMVDWTSLDNGSVYERTGTPCPSPLAPDDYCVGPTTVATVIDDSSTIVKQIVSDTYLPNNDAIVRVGDIVTYQLNLNLQPGTTRSVNVLDTLPAGLAFIDIVNINGDGVADYTPPVSGAGSNFSYSAITAAQLPVAGQTGSLSFSIGDVVNDPYGDATTDTITIVYRARVVEDVLAHQPSTILINTATLSYVDANSVAVVDPARLQSQAALNVYQPVMTVPTKIDRSGRPDFSNVEVAIDIMNYQLQSCNTTGLAPAYNIQLTDQLATQYDESSIAGPVNGPGQPDVYINGALAVAGVDYVYTAPVIRGGFMLFEVSTAINVGACVTIDYDIGFYTDFGANQNWDNAVIVDEYWSLPGQTGQLYSALGPTTFTLLNNNPFVPPVKTLLLPVSAEATIGEVITYQVTIPSSNAARYDVIVTDTLDPALEYIDVTEVSGNNFAVDDSATVAPTDITITHDFIPAGQDMILNIRARVTNLSTTNAAYSFNNNVTYTHADTPGGAVIFAGSSTTPTPLLIVEPAVSVAKAVQNISNPGNPPVAGDILRYTLTLDATGGAAGDNYSDAFDLTIEDQLTSGLLYQAGTATVGGGNSILEPVTTGDGITTAQSLTWSPANTNADIDIPEGGTVNVTYDVLVLDNVLVNQSLTNSVVARWTSLDGSFSFERNGSDSPTYNDYFTAPVTTTVTVPDNVVVTKSRLSDTYNSADDIVRIGDIVQFELRLQLQEGRHNNVVVTDTLPQGLGFETVLEIHGDTSAPFSGSVPFTYNDVVVTAAGDPLTGVSTISFDFGDVVNAADASSINDDIVIHYLARVINTVYPQQNNTAITNTVQLDHQTATGVDSKTDSFSLTLFQPQLDLSKTAAPAGGDTILVANEFVNYIVDITNNGTAPAYDVVIDDTIPVGLRNGAATVTPISVDMIDGVTSVATSLANVIPSYNPLTGVAVWNFDSNSLETYTINPGDTLRIEYQVQADPDIGSNLTLINQARAQLYYSFNDANTPSVNIAVGEREIYGPSTAATSTLTTGAPGPLLKENPADTAVSIGETFSYLITVPEVAVASTLNDVRILDNLATSAADLTFVSVEKVSGSGDWTPENTGTATNLVIEDSTGGIDIPANEQVQIRVTVRVENTANNFSGQTFFNTANYTYNQENDNPLTEQPTVDAVTGNMTIVGPDTLTLEKTGPASMRIGTPDVFILNVQNTGTGPAWDISITDQLPTFDPAPGGMCQAAPTNVVAQIFQSNGTTAVTPVLTEGVDYVTSFAAEPTCVFTITMTSAQAALAETNRLIVTYEASLDTDTPPNSSLINVAGTTEWFSYDTDGAGNGVNGIVKTFTEVLTDGTDTVLDHEDNHTTLIDTPYVIVQKRVINLTTSQDPGSNASPGDVLRYSILIQNDSPLPIDDFNFVDDLDALNAVPVFAAGTLTLVSYPATANISATNAFGGSKGTGQVDIRGLVLGAQGDANDQVNIEFDITLAPVITNGTVVLNQGFMQNVEVNLATDDPNVNGVDDPMVYGDENATETLISSAARLQVSKISTDMTDDPAVLISGDTLRYTITVQNVGTEDAVNAILRDQLPANTTYIANSTTLNGNPVVDTVVDELPLINGIAINSADITTLGYLRADATGSLLNSATITFDVTIDDNLVNGTLITNQGFVTAEGAGSPALPEKPSDDPATPAPDDPTIDVIGNEPLLDVLKQVAIEVDNSSPNILDPGDTLLYTITITNIGASDATDVVLTDLVPADTTYVADSLKLNGEPVGVPDGGVLPLIVGVPVSSSDLTPPLPTAGNGVITAGESAVISFNVQVDAGTPTGTIISNQGTVSSFELPDEMTDSDGDDLNGDQPTLIVVGNAQLVSISKQVTVMGGGPALAGGELEYRVRVQNIGLVPAMTIRIEDDLDLPVAGQMTYVAGSGLLNGLSTGVSYSAPMLIADYGTNYGSLEPGEFADLVFRVQLDAALPIGTTVTNIAQVYWNSDLQSDSDSVSIDIGGTPGVGNLNGTLWHDANFNNVIDSGERLLDGWQINLYRDTELLGSQTSDANGVYSFNGLVPNDTVSERYRLEFVAPGATSASALLGLADSPAALGFTNDLHLISNIVINSGSNLINLNLPIDPDGVIYDSIVRIPVAGATVSLLNATTGNAVSADCFDDTNQQNQVTLADGFYKFDINFSQADCVAGDNFLIQVTPPVDDYQAQPSVVITPQTDGTTAALDVPSCPGSANDAIFATGSFCEAQASEAAPPVSVAPMTAATSYFMHLQLDDTDVPGDSQIFNNHIPIDPVLTGAVAITKVSGLVNAVRGQLVPYTITVTNNLPVTLNANIVDTFPAGFKYIQGSGKLNDVAIDPVQNGLQLSWENIDLLPAQTQTIKLLLIVGAGANEGEYVNRAQVIDNLTSSPASIEATATVRVVPDPAFDCSDIIGKIYDDKNLNGYQDDDETGIKGVRVVTAKGLVITSDQQGRFHVTCAVTPSELRGSNLILKVDERSLPSGYRMTTENPRVIRATRGKLLKFNFGATLHRVVSMDLANGVFKAGGVEIHDLWKPRVDLLLEYLQQKPSVLHLSYLADTERESLVESRLEKLKSIIRQRWEEEENYRLIIETEIFWRRGKPAGLGGLD